jgi:hypothetical protein
MEEKQKMFAYQQGFLNKSGDHDVYVMGHIKATKVCAIRLLVALRHIYIAHRLLSCITEKID